jgi:hypothetical protein
VIGKTIRVVEDLGHSGLALHFTDGTMAKFEGTGYESDNCRATEYTFEQRLADIRERQGEREQACLDRLIAHARKVNNARERIEAAARFDLDTEHGRAGFLAWEDWRWPSIDRLLKEVWMDPFRDMLNRQVYGQQIRIPIRAKPDGRTPLQKQSDAILRVAREVLS